jgi:putrescine transport system permease protein
MIERLWRRLPNGRSLVTAVPYLWLLLFFLIPFAIVLKISFSSTLIAMPPYEPLLHWTAEKVLQIKLNLGNYAFLVEDNLYWMAYLNSIKVAAVSTLFCLLIGYPIAYSIARSKPSIRNILMLLIVLPFWTSFLLRVYAWIGILKNNGLLNNFLMWIGVIDQPIQMLQTDFAVYVGIVYSYLPFMILPLYANLVKMDFRLLEAAYDLGTSPFKAFWLVTVPLSKAGIVAGFMLVFIPAVGEFVIPSLLGGPENIMIGRVVWDEMFTSNNWPRASALAVVMILLIIVPLAIYYYYVGEQAERHE